MEGKNIFTDEVHIHLLQLPAERERQEWSWQEGGWAARGCDSRQQARRPGPKPVQARQGAVTVCLGDSTEVRLLLGGGEAEGRGGGVCSRRSQRHGRGAQGRSARVGKGTEEGGGGSASQHSDHGVPTTPL